MEDHLRALELRALEERLQPCSVTTPKAETRWDPRRRFRGLWAREPLGAGEIVWVSYLYPESCEFLTWADLQARPEMVKYAYQIGPDLFSHSKVVEDDPSNYFNHSCDPNTWYEDGRDLRLKYFLDYVMPAWMESVPSLLGRTPEVRGYFESAWNGHGVSSSSHASLNEARRTVDRLLLAERDIEFIVARRDIAANEEITMDYATFWTVCDQDFECLCGTPSCRRILRAGDWRLYPPEHCALYVRQLVGARAQAASGGRQPSPITGRPALRNKQLLGRLGLSA